MKTSFVADFEVAEGFEENRCYNYLKCQILLGMSLKGAMEGMLDGGKRADDVLSA